MGSIPKSETHPLHSLISPLLVLLVFFLSFPSLYAQDTLKKQEEQEKSNVSPAPETSTAPGQASQEQPRVQPQKGKQEEPSAIEDKEIIQRITERVEYKKYLSQNESNFTRHSRSLLSRLWDQVSTLFKDFFFDSLRQRANSSQPLSWLEKILSFPLWETFIFLLLLALGVLLYRIISKRRISVKDDPDVSAPNASWQNLLRIPDAWRGLIKEILQYYLSSIQLTLQPDMSLRHCMRLLKDNQRDDAFIRELVEFLEKWHFSTWQPDEKIIRSWFRSIQEKAEYFRELKLDVSDEQAA